jgi:primosomal protein DnaI
MKEQVQLRRKNLIRSHHIPKDIYEASFKTIETNSDRCVAIDAAVEFCSRFRTKNRPSTGLYLYGSLGVGKSRIAGAIQNELVRYNVESFMFYVPEFMREVIESIHDHSLHSKLEQLKNVSVLILDDIGAEFLTPWKRDEILGAILQHRVAEQLPTIFTSNLDLDELEKHLANTNRDSADVMKATRVMERIRHYTVAYHVEGKNWREERKK